MQSDPPLHILRQALRANREHGFVYLNNPKVGCSTVKANLWSAASGRPVAEIRQEHVVEGSPFDDEISRLDWAETGFVFTFVRNPFPRIVSAYLDKLVKRSDQVWNDFARRLGVDAQDQISFNQFVEMIADIPPERQDPHWRPQHANILHPLVRPNFIADLEEMNRLLPEVIARLFPGRSETVVPRVWHRTRARESLAEHLQDPGTRARLRRLYAGDFELYGYATDPDAGLSSQLEPRMLEHQHPDLHHLARRHAAEAAR